MYLSRWYSSDRDFSEVTSSTSQVFTFSRYAYNDECAVLVASAATHISTVLTHMPKLTHLINYLFVPWLYSILLSNAILLIP